MKGQDASIHGSLSRRPVRVGVALMLGGLVLVACADRAPDAGGDDLLPTEPPSSEQRLVGRVPPGDFASPVRGALGPSGTLYVADYGAQAVFELAVGPGAPRIVREWQVRGTPLGIAWAGGRLFLGNAERRSVEVYDADGRHVRYLGYPGTILDPTDIAVDEAGGRVYVLDGLGAAIRVYDFVRGTALGVLVSGGRGEFELQHATGIAIDPVRRELLVSDYGDPASGDAPPRIKIFGLDGSPRATISGKLGMLGQRFSRPQGLAASGGRIYVPDAVAGEVLVLDRASGATLGTIGTFGAEPGQLTLPLDVTVDASGSLYVVNNRLRRIEVFPAGVASAPSSGSPDPVIAAPRAGLGPMLNPNHQCAFCHGVHGGSTTQLLRNAVVLTLCLSCHGPTGISSLKADVHVYSNSTCRDCHVSHDNVRNWLGGTNLKLVRDTVVNPFTSGKRPVVFESRGVVDANQPKLHSFCDGDEDGNGVWDGVCDTCHNNTGRHRYTDPGSHSHQQGNTCTRCHLHSAQFRK